MFAAKHVECSLPISLRLYPDHPCNKNLAMDAHSNDFSVYVDRGHQIPMNQVADCVNDQENPDDEVSEELNEVDDVESFGIESNASVDDGHCKVNLAKKIHCNVSVDRQGPPDTSQ